MKWTVTCKNNQFVVRYDGYTLTFLTLGGALSFIKDMGGLL